MGREGHRRGEESDALAAIARKLLDGAPPAPVKAAAAPAAATTPPAAQPEGKEVTKKDKRAKKDASEKKKKRKHEAAVAAAAAERDGPGEATLLPEPATPEGRIKLALQGLRQAAAALQEAAGQGTGNPSAAASLQQHLDALAACAEQLCAALSAVGAAQPPTALQLLQSQVRLLLNSCQPSQSGSRPALPPSAPQLTAMQLQAAAAAAAVEQRLAQPAGPAVDDPGQRLRFQQHYMATFADCFSAEVEALQEAEPPIPAGVLLQCVRMAADSEALHPGRLRAVVLDAAAAGQL